MDKNSFDLLIDKYLEGKATDNEAFLLEEYYKRLEMKGESHLTESERALLKDEMYRNILSATGKERKLIPLYKRRFSQIAAAAVLLAVLAGGYFLFFNKNEQPDVTALKPEHTRFQNDVKPGGEKAVLVMSDGREVVLEGNAQQNVRDQNGALIMNDNGVITYDNSKAYEVVYNSLKVPRKGEYSLVLNDGSIVKLNSESSIYYPNAFRGNERKVEVTGETYFEVAKDESKPFIVLVKGMEIKVLGTHFNVNAYDNEAIIRTTLTEGSVEVSRQSVGESGKSIVIKPGQQAVLTSDGKLVVRDDVDMSEVLAWTTGFFNFKNADIETIMRQVERWYDVDVVFESRPNKSFVAEIPRGVNASDFFRILEATGWVHFRIEGRKVVVMK